MSLNERRQKIQENWDRMSIRWQCQALKLCRGRWYYRPKPMSEKTLALMDLIDRQYMDTPFYGRPRITEYLRRLGHWVNPKRVGRLMRLMGLRGIMPRLNSSKPNPKHPVYPYLLRGLAITKANQVWAADITYVRLKRGFMYLVAVIDVYSRKILSWQLSNTLDTEFCVESLESALKEAKPEIFNTDQGSQFTSYAFTDVLKTHSIQISMDGKGRALDNVFMERFWRSLKYECLYLRQFEKVSDLRLAIKKYVDFYNTQRFHQSLNYKTPQEVYSAIFVTNLMDLIGCGYVWKTLRVYTYPQPLLRS